MRNGSSTSFNMDIDKTQKILSLANDGVKIESHMIEKIDEIIEMYRMIRQYHFKRKRTYLSMVARAKKGNITGVVDAFKHNMPKPLKYKL